MSEEQLYETYEQKVNTLEDEICNHEKMSAIMDKDLKIDSKLIEAIFKPYFKKATKENGDKVIKVLNNFYKYHPFLIPFVGKDYPQNDKKKFLFVMESHYLPEFSDFYVNMPRKSKDKNEWLKEQWYKRDFSWEKLQSSPESEISLCREDIDYICTESVVKNNIKNNNKFKALFRNMLKPIFNIENDQIENTIKSIAFMNYFLRPSEYTGVSIKGKDIDKLFSYLNLIRVWKALDEPYIIICSAIARKSFYFYWKEHKKCLEDPGVKNIVDDTAFTTDAEFCLCNHPNNRSWNKPIEEDENEKDKNSEWNKNDTNSKKRLEDFMISINKSFAEIA